MYLHEIVCLLLVCEEVKGCVGERYEMSVYELDSVCVFKRENLCVLCERQKWCV